MKQPKKIAEGRNYTAINMGDPDDTGCYTLIHAKTKKEVYGKLFLKALTGATGTEISFTAVPPKTELAYFHKHNQDEETYIILKGAGYYQVDGDCFAIERGSVIRVAPDGVRGLCNTSEEEMIYLCIQSKENSLDEHTYDDGTRVECEPLWSR
ncbi:cupin domain-containing protein [uncultured Alistipes sp.]|jgi:hypothetical protein|uniref:cupin domain-containing protein n=1 Tax=uncultured Alistipes sp. TaxID=538949 RepID=UPI0025E4143B|nr:cupin domain-containing protein [uncultured Alistipes sp.]